MVWKTKTCIKGYNPIQATIKIKIELQFTKAEQREKRLFVTGNICQYMSLILKDREDFNVLNSASR